MAMIHWMGGAVGVGIITVAGGNIYADQKLKAFYQEPKDKSSLSYVVQNYDMGLMSGTVKSTVHLVWDPCQPNAKSSFEVTDHISRGLFGYTINTEITYPENFKKDLTKVFGNQQPLNIESKINWLGQLKVHITSPVIDHKEDGLVFNSKGLDTTFKYNTNEPYLLKDLEFNLPSITVSDEQNYFSLDKLNLTANKMHLYQIIDGAESKISLNHLRFKTYLGQSTDFNLENLSGFSKVNISKDLLDLDSEFKVGKFSIPQSDEFGKLETNFSIKDVDANKLKEMYAVMDEMATTCSPDADAQLQRVGLAVLEKGLKVESKNNSIKLGDTDLKADFSAQLDKADYANLSAFLSAAPMKATAEGRIETTKAFVTQVLKLNPQTASLASDQTEQVLQQLSQQGMIKVAGDKITSQFEYKFGSPRFVNN